MRIFVRCMNDQEVSFEIDDDHTVVHHVNQILNEWFGVTACRLIDPKIALHTPGIVMRDEDRVEPEGRYWMMVIQ